MIAPVVLRAPLVNRTAGLVLAYEAAALISGGRLPTITELAAHHRWLGPSVLTGLAVHLWISRDSYSSVQELPIAP